MTSSCGVRSHTQISPSAGRIRYGAEVVAITHPGFDRVRTKGTRPGAVLIRLANGGELLASAVIDASGTWRRPNVFGGSGISARGESVVGDRVVHALPEVLGCDRDRFASRRTAVIGADHSSATTLLELGELVDQVPETEGWCAGSDQARAYGGGDADELPARGALGSRLKRLVQSGKVTLVSGFRIEELRSTASARVQLTSGDQQLVVDTIVNSTGLRPDREVVSELRLDLDPILGSTRALTPLIDPNEHSCGTVPAHAVDELAHPEPDYYAIGASPTGAPRRSSSRPATSRLGQSP